MVKGVSMSENTEESKEYKKILKIIFSLVITLVGNFSLVFKAANITLGDRFFYFLTITWYLYFPFVFAKYYGNDENKLISYWNNIKYYYPPIFSLIFTIGGLTELSYFIAVIINVVVIDIIGVIYIFKLYGSEKKIWNKSLSIIGLVLLSGFSIIGQLYFPFTKVSPWRILLFEMLWTALIADGIQKLLSNFMKGDHYKNPRRILNLGATFFIISLVFTSAAPLTVSNRTPIIAVESGSMAPFINKGDLVFLYYVDPEDIENGSVIAYYSEDLYSAEEPITIHRVINKWYAAGKWRFRTRGDNNTIDDPYVVAEDLIYGVFLFKIVGLGQILVDLEDMNFFPNFFIGTIILFSLTICLGIGIYLLRRRKIKPEISRN